MGIFNISNNSRNYENGGLNTKPRVDYIDLVKGVTILWIIWMHTDCLPFDYYRNPIFFFISGLFFKIEDTKTFFSKRIFFILIPFLFFYITSIPYKYFMDVWESHSFFHFDWSSVLSLFKITDIWHYLSVNITLWFLLTLFFIQVYSFILFRLPRWLIGVSAVISLVLFDKFNSIPSPFMMNNAIAWYSYFAMGYLIGKPLLGYLNSLTRKVFVFVTTVIILVLCILFNTFETALLHSLIIRTKYLVFIVSFISFMSFFNNWNKLNIIRFFGKNTLIVLGAHLWILQPLHKIFFSITGEHHARYGIMMVILTALTLIPVINWLNKYLPYMVGKQSLINFLNGGQTKKYLLTENNKSPIKRPIFQEDR